jgi:hypothetical protein
MLNASLHSKQKGFLHVIHVRLKGKNLASQKPVRDSSSVNVRIFKPVVIDASLVSKL